MIEEPRLRAFWQRFQSISSVEHDEFSVRAFGESPAACTAYARAAARGHKRVNATLLRAHAERPKPLPVRGDYFVVLDGVEHPTCVCRVRSVAIKPFGAIDDDDAASDGGASMTLERWRRVNAPRFARACAALGIPFNDTTPIVLERFATVWRPQRR